MFCKNCGNQIPDDSSFCTNCGVRVNNETEVQSAPVENTGVDAHQSQEQFNPPVQEEINAPVQEQFYAPVQAEAPGFYDAMPDMRAPKKKGKKIAIISILVAIVLAAGGVVTWLLLRDDEGGTSGSKEGYKAEIEAYLEYLADINDDAEDFVADTHMTGTSFPAGYSGKEAEEIMYIYMEAMFEQEKEFSDMYYSDMDDCDTWQDYIKEGMTANVYDEIENVYGDDWELTYKIGDDERIDKDDLEDWEDSWDEIIDDYKSDILEPLEESISKKDKEKIEEFIESLEEMKITDGYTVEVEVEIKGDEKHKDDYEFVVLKVGKQWVIFEGPSWMEILNLD